MKAVRIHSEGDGGLRLDEVQPPASMQDDEVLVHIRDAGVNRFDFAGANGTPRTVGVDFSGQVVESGDRAGGFSPGDRVFGFADGSYAEYAIIASRRIARMPRTTDFDAAAALPTPALSAYQIMMHEVQVEAEQAVLVLGAASTVGSLAVQLGVWQGAHVIAVASSEDAPYLSRLGARRTLDYREPFESLVGEVDAVVDFWGGNVTARAYGVVRRGGILVAAGGALDPAALERHGLRGTEFRMQPNGAQLGVVARLVDEGILQPQLGRVLPLEDASLARELVRSHGTRGKIVLAVSHP